MVTIPDNGNSFPQIDCPVGIICIEASGGTRFASWPNEDISGGTQIDSRTALTLQDALDVCEANGRCTTADYGPATTIWVQNLDSSNTVPSRTTRTGGIAIWKLPLMFSHTSPKLTFNVVCGITSTSFSANSGTTPGIKAFTMSDYFLLLWPSKNYEINNFHASNPLCPLESVAVTSIATGTAADFTYNSNPVAKTGWTALGAKINLEFPQLVIYERYFTFRVRGTAKGHINTNLALANQAIAHQAFTSDIKVRMVDCTYSPLVDPVLGQSV